MATTFWNQGEKKIIRGLDVLGFRQVDQNVEKNWVSGITTISYRARYLSLIPWLITEYYQQRGIDGETQVEEPDYDELIGLTRRLELVVLAATRHTDALADQRTGGLIGPDLFVDEMAALDSGESVPLDLTRGGGSYGTYVAPCRAFGLLAYENLPSSWAPKLTPRTRLLLDCRRALAAESKLADAVLNGGSIGAEVVASEAHMFSASGLLDSRCEAERRVLENALLTPEPTQDQQRYERFRQTVRMVLNSVAHGEGVSSKVIANTYAKVVQRTSWPVEDVLLLWATYELHRRVHFALELLLSATTAVVIENDGATTGEVISAWTTDDFPSELENCIRVNSFEWSQSLTQFIDGVIDEPFLSGPVERRTGRQMPSPGAKAAFALALLCATWRQSRSMRAHYGELPGSRAGMCSAFPIIDRMKREALLAAVHELVNRCVVEAHLDTTLRKMAHGMKCSLRFFPDGRMLRPTGMTIGGGYSGDRLGNVIGILSDLGFLVQGQNAALSERGKALLKGLEAGDAK